LREKHAILEKFVAKQSSEPAGDKVAAKTAGRKETKKSVEKTAVPGKA
jgi:hypothetical protein